jgi:DegV family protein with EDD domain
MFGESKAKTRSSTLSVLKNIHLLRLSAAQFAAIAATYAIFFSSVVIIEEITQSSALMGVMMFSLSLPGFIFGMLAGVWVDRHNRRHVFLKGNSLSLVTALAFAVGTRWLKSDPLLLLTIFVCNFLLSALLQLTASARDAVLPRAVKAEQLLSANSVMQIALVGAQGVGTIFLAPVLLHAGGAQTVGMVGFLLFTLAAWGYSKLPDWIGEVTDRKEDKHQRVVWEEIKEGWWFIVGKPIIRSAIAYLVLMSGLILVIMTLLPGLVSRTWDFPIEQMPLLAIPGGLGFGLGVVILGRFGNKAEEEVWLSAGLFSMGTGLASLMLIHELAGFSIIIFLMIAIISGCGAALIVIPARTLVQEQTPDAMRGRVTSTQLFLSNALSMAPLPLLGGMADLFGVQRMFTSLGLFLLVTAIYTLRGTRPERRVIETGRSVLSDLIQRRFQRGRERVVLEQDQGGQNLRLPQAISTMSPTLEAEITSTQNLAEGKDDASSHAPDQHSRIGKIAIVTDSASNLPSEVVDEYGINVVPVCLHWDEEILRDGIDIGPSEVYQRLRRSESLPTTTAPSVGDFLQTYLRLGADVNAIVSIHLPDRLSGVIASARLAADLIKEQVAVHVVDAGTAAMGAGFVALAAARAASEGLGVESIQCVTQEIRKRVYVFAMLDTLEYLHRGGRIGKAEVLLGVALQIKPILFINDGVVDVLAKPRTAKRAVQVMLDEMDKRIASRPVRVAVLHADAPEGADDLRYRVEKRFNCIEIFTCAFTPVMGVHAGPGVIGLAFYAEDK